MEVQVAIRVSESQNYQFVTIARSDRTVTVPDPDTIGGDINSAVDRAVSDIETILHRRRQLDEHAAALAEQAS